MYELLYRALVRLGRRWGGVRPRRVVHWVARRAWGGRVPAPREHVWCRDRWGAEFLLHPHYHIDYQIQAFGTYELRLQQYIERHVRPGMVCFDVGANIGAVSLHLAARVAPSGRVHGFEPVPHLRDRLRLHVERNGFHDVVSIHDCALSSADGEMELALAAEGEPNQGMASLVDRSPAALSRRLTVPTRSLDSLAAEWGLEQVDLMKVDIQGAEIWLLEGGAELFARCGPDLLMEVAPRELRGMGADSRDLLAKVEEMGYSCYRLRSSGRIGARLRASRTAPDFSSSGILCSRREK